MVETFCLSLLESMSAGLLCVHSNYGCLPETSSNWTMMYNYHEEIPEHKNILYKSLKNAIKIIDKNETIAHLKKQKQYVDYHYNWNKRTQDWLNLFNELEKMPLKKIKKTISINY
jgi:glycosyltransferase involved in cell wall biosynthesis